MLMPLLTTHKVGARWYIGMPFTYYAVDPGSIPASGSNLQTAKKNRPSIDFHSWGSAGMDLKGGKRCGDDITDDENTMLKGHGIHHAVEGQESDLIDKSKQLLKSKDYKLSAYTYEHYYPQAEIVETAFNCPA